MPENIVITRATLSDAEDIAEMTGELLREIMKVAGIKAFNFSVSETIERLKYYIEGGKLTVFVARKDRREAVGFITLSESYALYTEGAFGTIPELFVRADVRNQKIGNALVEKAKSYGREKGWKRLEVTTPPLPQFEKTLAFYEREGFTITGGRKLKVLI